MTEFELAACFVALLGWAPAQDFLALARGFAAERRLEPGALTTTTRLRLGKWMERNPDSEPMAAAEAAFRSCSKLGARVLHPASYDYPKAFFDLEKPPIFLSWIGHAPWRRRASLSIFGSRQPSPSALAWMNAHLPDLLQRRDVCVVSGGARGVDRRAHALALAGERPTVAFLPSGLAQPYPSDLGDWFARIRDGGGAVISEFLPEQLVRRAAFERRNRMIAALGAASFAVEGRRRSGTTMTAGLARDLGRPVCALPGSPMEARAAGALDLIVDGACPIRDSADLEAFLDSAIAQENRARL